MELPLFMWVREEKLKINVDTCRKDKSNVVESNVVFVLVLLYFHL